MKPFRENWRGRGRWRALADALNEIGRCLNNLRGYGVDVERNAAGGYDLTARESVEDSGRLFPFEVTTYYHDKSETWKVRIEPGLIGANGTHVYVPETEWDYEVGASVYVWYQALANPCVSYWGGEIDDPSGDYDEMYMIADGGDGTSPGDALKQLHMGTFTIPQPERYTLVQLDSESPTGNAWHECDGSSLTENGHTYTVPHAAGSILAATGQIPEYEGTGSPIQTIPRGRSGHAGGRHSHEPNGNHSYFEVENLVGMANFVPGDRAMSQQTSEDPAMPITFGRKMFMRL